MHKECNERVHFIWLRNESRNYEDSTRYSNMVAKRTENLQDYVDEMNLLDPTNKLTLDGRSRGSRPSRAFRGRERGSQKN